MKALLSLVLVVVVFRRLVWLSTPVTSPNGMKPRTQGDGDGATGTKRVAKGEWGWPTFDQDVSNERLLELDERFLAPCHNGLYQRLRQGQVDFGVRVPQTVGEHVANLVNLVDDYKELKGFTERDVLVMSLMAKVHEISEIMTDDIPQFELPEDFSERRRFLKVWVPPTPKAERARWLIEWRVERPFIEAMCVGLSLEDRRIILYLFDRFYLGRDKLAKLLRDFHYLEPALDIRRRTRSMYIREVHYQRAVAVIHDSTVQGHLDWVCRK